MGRKVSKTVAAVVAMAITSADARSAEMTASDQQAALVLKQLKESDKGSVVDYGFGTGVKRPSLAHRVQAIAARMITGATPGVPQGGPGAGVEGVFGAPVTWPIIPIHMVLLPDGRVMNYGTGADGTQGAKFTYDVWDPARGTDGDAHLVLPNTTAADMFCSAQSVMWANGKVLVTGGDLAVNGKRNFAASGAEVFDPSGNVLTSTAAMTYPRWYPSIVPLANGELFVIGGVRNKVQNGQISGVTLAATPEIFNPATGWRALPGANAAVDWYYPRAFLTPAGKILVVDQSGKLWSYDPKGNGSVRTLPQTVPAGSTTLPTVMYAPGKLLSVRAQAAAVVIDLSGANPVVTPTGKLSQERFWASGTLLADGRVLVTGGSSVSNSVTGSAYSAEIWDPLTGHWTLGAASTKPRLYHSNALLLPDGSVVTGGGGAPGPIKNLNAEIYYPSYLYRTDGSGQPAIRPSLDGVPATAVLGQTVAGTVGANDTIGRVTLVRTGSATHSTNHEQRFVSVPFAQNGQQLLVTLPSDTNTVFPGYHMLFAFNAAGVPSVARIVLVTQ